MPAQSTAEAEIRKLIDDITRAIEAKDVDRIMSHYADDITMYDAIPPFQQDRDTLAQSWSACLPYFPEVGTYRVVKRDERLHLTDGMAVVHWLNHFDCDDKDHPCGKGWLRMTSCCRKVDGQWKIFHDHISAPFDCETSQAVMDPDAPAWNADETA